MDKAVKKSLENVKVDELIGLDKSKVYFVKIKANVTKYTQNEWAELLNAYKTAFREAGITVIIGLFDGDLEVKIEGEPNGKK